MKCSGDGWVLKQEVRRRGWSMARGGREVNSALEKNQNGTGDS